MMRGYDLFLYDANGHRVGSINKFTDGYQTREIAEESRKDFLRQFRNTVPDVRAEPITDADFDIARQHHGKP